jgi:hypothetical protein
MLWPVLHAETIAAVLGRNITAHTKIISMQFYAPPTDSGNVLPTPRLGIQHQLISC